MTGPEAVAGGNPDVLIVGAGPSGSSLAAQMARRGWKVTVVDKADFPRPKPCGEFVSPGAVRALARLGLPESRFRGTAAELKGWTLSIGDRSVSADFKGDAPGLSLSRARLDSELVDHARAAGAVVRTRTRYVRCSHWAREGDPTVEVRTPEGLTTLTPHVLVGAGGLRCPVATHLGVVKRKPRIRKVSLTARVRGVNERPTRGRLFVRGDLTVGLAPSDPAGDLWNATLVVPSGRYGRQIAADSPAFFRESLARVGLKIYWDSAPDGEFPEPVLWASGPFDRPTTDFHRGRTVLVGDAAGYFDPFTGQGIYQALRSAEVLAAELHRALAEAESFQSAFASYGSIVKRERRATTWVQRAVEWALSEKRQTLAMATLNRSPGLYGKILDVTTDTDTLFKRMIRLGRTKAPKKDVGSPGDPSPTQPHVHKAAIL